MNHYKKYLVAIAIILTLVNCKNNLDKTSTKPAEVIKDSVLIPAESKLAKPMFPKKLRLNNISFEINLIDKELTIQPSGLEIDNSKVVKQIEGTVSNAEIADLNSDGFPEVLVYITSDGSGSYGSIIGYSVNNGKSMSEISFPNAYDNPKINKGYMGHDEFAIEKNIFHQRFPIYNPQDTNSNPSSKMRQIQYKLKDSENSRVFVVDKIIEY